MFNSYEGLYTALIVSAALIFLLIIIIVLAIKKNLSYHKKHLQEKDELKVTYQYEMLSAQLEIKDHTLNTISQEIHDNIGQILSLVRLNINQMEASDNKDLAVKIKETNSLVGKAIQDLRNLTKTLNVEYVRSQPLSESINVELNQIREIWGHKIELQIDGYEKNLDPQKQLIIFRIAQEALNNIIKHAEATQIIVKLEYYSDNLIMSIQDNGVGFDFSSFQKSNFPDKGVGIRNMFYRTKLIGGFFTLESNIGTGTIYKLNLPT